MYLDRFNQTWDTCHKHTNTRNRWHSKKSFRCICISRCRTSEPDLWSGWHYSCCHLANVAPRIWTDHHRRISRSLPTRTRLFGLFHPRGRKSTRSLPLCSWWCTPVSHVILWQPTRLRGSLEFGAPLSPLLRKHTKHLEFTRLISMLRAGQFNNNIVQCGLQHINYTCLPDHVDRRISSLVPNIITRSDVLSSFTVA